ncbi:MAG: SUMF1/EgtB/PvdO family nonheme iron enzyme [Planctomycetota bacterium]|jgi:hypothetical protein|nr:SUMF1/EgtB/PvdO family nonheme iron enzyme [Planctomycetota bacterium]
MRTFLPLALATFLCTGCGVSGDLGLATDGGDQTGELAGNDGAVRLATADYLILDIATGTVTARAAAPDLDNGYRSQQIVFRRVGSGGNEVLIGVFELTQAQWQALGGSAVWSGLPAAVVGSSPEAGDKPTFALSYDELEATLASYRSRTGIQLGAPTRNQWYLAANANTSYSWGNTTQLTTVKNHAVTWDTLDGVRGPRSVGKREPNALGLYDVHGNVWEWCAPGDVVCGGSWADSISLARADNQLSANDGGIDQASSHALFGARLVLIPNSP